MSFRLVRYLIGTAFILVILFSAMHAMTSPSIGENYDATITSLDGTQATIEVHVPATLVSGAETDTFTVDISNMRGEAITHVGDTILVHTVSPGLFPALTEEMNGDSITMQVTPITLKLNPVVRVWREAGRLF